MICFFDTDILLKLITFRLLKQSLTALGVISEKDVYVTPEAASKCRNSKHERTDFRQETLNQALDFLKKVAVISKPGDPEELNLLLEIEEGMDAGETTLFLATRGETDFILLTGDKRALRALTNNFLSQELHNRHLKRVLCLEALILLIIRREGFVAIHEKLLMEQSCDKAIQKALLAGEGTERKFIETLESYIRRLEEETQGLLLDI